MFTLRLLGTPSLKAPDGATPPGLGWGKPLALLAFLAVRGEARRDEIVDLLWRDVDEAKARNAFRQALHRLRSGLGESLIPQDRELLRLAPSGEIDVDLHEFAAAASAGRTADAVNTYRGDFLNGVTLGEPAFDLWADQERNRLRVQYRALLEQSIGHAQAAGQWADAIATARRLIDVAPLDESAARTVATTFLSAGRRTEARDVLVQFGTRLHAELGLPMPVELQSLLTRLDRMTPAPATHSAAQPAAPGLAFAGREAELSRLLSLWRTTRDDAGALALIEGDAGMGKSRLIQELVVHARSLRRSTVLVARERPAAAQVPFALFADAFRPLVRAAGIVGASRHLLAEASRLLPELRDSIELPPLADIEDEAARVRFFEGVAALVDAAAYEHPLLIALDDLQHIGPSSLDLLSYLTARLAGSAVMFVLGMRGPDAPVAVATRLRALARDGESARAVRIVLSPLDRASTSLAAAADDLRQRYNSAVVDRLLDRAEGVPGRLPDLLRLVAAGDDLAQPPVSVRALMQERLQKLSSSHRRAFLVLALLGRPASLKTLADAAHLSESAAAETAAALEAEGFIDATGNGYAPDAAAAGVALDSAGPASRAFLAGWISDALAADPSTPAAERARFQALAGRAHDAFGSSRKAAFDAMRVGAWPEAVQQLQVARTFAGDAASVADIEGLLAALGAGNLRIPSAAGLERAPSASTEPTLTPASEPDAGLSLWTRWFPNWRLLLGAAVATLLVSALVMSRAPTRSPAVSALRDTLVVIEGSDGGAEHYVTGDLVSGFTVSEALDARSAASWADSLTRPWADPVVGPRGLQLAATRVGASASDVFVISADRRDTIALTRGEIGARALGWSPDSRWVLIATSRSGPDGRTDTDLFAARADGAGRVVLDTAAHRSVVEAAWSPDGSRIAWVARVGAEPQQEVFVSFADGSRAENVTRHPADDYHIGWSGDGELLGFTSMRDGNAELYAVSMREGRLWRLTRDPAQDDFARFSSTGRLVAFESTRGGRLGVHVMAALGGEPLRVQHSEPLSVYGWRGNHRYVEHVRLEAERIPEPGDTVALRVAAVDQLGDSIGTSAIGISVVDVEAGAIVADSAAQQYRFTARRAGLVRVVADAGRWRFDTALIRVGRTAVTLIEGRGAPADWRLLGYPAPIFEPGGVALNGDGEWESGVLSRVVIPLAPSLVVRASLDSSTGTAQARSPSFSLALVAPEQPAALDSLAPQFLRYASLTWDSDARRLVYAVGREVFSEQGARPTTIVMRVESDSTVSFSVSGSQRWRSTLRISGARSASSAQVWLGGRSTGRLRVSGVRVMLERL